MIKFGNLKFDGVAYDAALHKQRLVNIGDAAELLAIDRLYNLMGIPSEDINTINYSDLLAKESGRERYSYTILPVNFAVFPDGLGYDMLHFPDYVIPVYLGLALMNHNLTSEQLEYLKNMNQLDVGTSGPCGFFVSTILMRIYSGA